MSKFHNTWPSITFVRNVKHFTVGTRFAYVEGLVVNNENRVKWKR